MAVAWRCVVEGTWAAAGSGVPKVCGSEEDVGARLDALNAWFVAKGGGGEARAEIDSHSGRAGLCARSDLAVDDVYLRIPRAVLLERDGVALGEGVRDALRRVERRVDLLRAGFGESEPSWAAKVVSLCRRLLLERELGEASTHEAYVASLPRDFSSHPLAWPRCADAQLEGTFFLEQLVSARGAMRSFIALSRISRDDALADVSREDLAWAYMIWLSRCIGVVDPSFVDDAEGCFVPMVDMTNCCWSEAASCSCTVWEAQREAAVMTTPVALKKGAAIFENYGWSNFEYMLSHGFFHDEPFADDAVFARPRPALIVSYFQSDDDDTARSARHFLLAQLGVGTSASWYSAAAPWRPALYRARAMRLRTERAPRGLAEQRWLRGRNASLLVALTLELHYEDAQRAATAAAARCDADPLAHLEQALADVAKPPALARAWRRLAAIACAEADDYERCARPFKAAPPNDACDEGEASLVRLVRAAAAFRDSQLALALAIAADYEQEAVSCEAALPPPY